MRDGIAAIATQQIDIGLLGEVTNADEVISAFRELRPDITLVNLQMPGKSGLDAVITALRRGIISL